MSFNSITVSYNGNNILINDEDKGPIPNNFSFNNSLSGRDLQYLMRKLDCIKDGKEGDGITAKKEIMNLIFPGQDNVTDDTLKTIRDQLLKDNDNLISPDSWLKSSSCTVSYEYIKNVFYETGLDPEDFIVDFKNPSEKSFSMIGSFPSEIGDPGSRKPEKFDVRFPDERTPLTFEASFMNYFGFGEKTNYSATLTNIINKVGTYKYSIDLGPAFNNENNVFGAEIRPRDNSALVINRFTSTTPFKSNETFESCNKTFPLINEVSADEYFKGNNYKNSLINVLYAKNPSSNLPEIKRYIISKEMGDVMQVLLMMVWQLVQSNSDKRIYCMTSLDSIVFMLCIILEQPCMYTHNSNKGLEKEDKCYRLQYYYPAVVTAEERMKTRFQQKYVEIFNSNLKIKNFYNRIFIEKIIYIGNTKIEYSNDKRKLENLNTYFFKPIQTAFDEISQGLETYKNTNENGVLSESLLDEMHNKFFILPIFGLKEKNKKKIYYINPGISNYTAEREYLFIGIEKPSFWEVFQKINSNTLSLAPISGVKRMRGGSALTNQIDLIPNEPTIFNSNENLKPSISLDNNQLLEPSDNNADSMEIEDQPLASSLDLGNSTIVDVADKMDVEEKEEIKSFTEKLFLTFISQVVDNLKNNTDLQLSPGDNEFGVLDQDAIYYYYYDMIVYISYIKKFVYYDLDLLEVMRKLKLYAQKQFDLNEILNIPIPVIELGLDDELEGCKINASFSEPSGIEYTNELFNTLNAIKNEVLKSDEEMALDYIPKDFPDENNEMEIENKMDNNNELVKPDNELNLAEPMIIDKKEDFVTPELMKKSSSSSDNSIEPVNKRARNFGGTKKKKKAKKVNKTRKSNKKRSIKKKPSRRKQKKPSRRKQKKTRRKSFK